MEFSTSNLRWTFILQKLFSGSSKCVQDLVGQMYLGTLYLDVMACHSVG